MNRKKRRKKHRNNHKIEVDPIIKKTIQVKPDPFLTGAQPKQTATIGRTASRRIRKVIELLAGILTVLGVLQLFLHPHVQTPSKTIPNNPFSIPFEITNENVLPLMGVEYTCEVLTIKVKNMPNIKFDNDKWSNMEPARNLWGRQSMTARCDKALSFVGFPIERSEYRLSLRYIALPWPFPMHSTQDFVAITDEAGTVVRWVPK